MNTSESCLGCLEGRGRHAIDCPHNPDYYCKCESPVIDVEHDAGCRRCGQPVDFSPAAIVRTAPSVRVDSLEARRVELADRLTNEEPPRWEPLERRQGERRGVDRRGRGIHQVIGETLDEAGSVDVRTVATLTAVAAVACVVAVALVAVWHLLVGGTVLYVAWRHLTRTTRRRRPRSSWSSLGRTVALMYAAWNSRWLKVDRRVTVPRRATTTPDVHELELDSTIPY